MKRSIWGWIALLLCGLAATCCTTLHKSSPTPESAETAANNAGYSLLYRLMNQESYISKLLIIKQTAPAIDDLIKQISNRCNQARETLDQFHSQDPTLNLTKPGLPEIEQQTRVAIKSTETKQLLFTSGKAFEIRLIFTQAEAMNYGAHLAKALSDQEKDPHRKEFLTTLAQHCRTFHDQLIDQLK